MPRSVSGNYDPKPGLTEVALECYKSKLFDMRLVMKTSDKDLRAQAKVFKAFCDPKRLAILEQLRSGEKCACQIQAALELTQSGLSYHMKILCDSGVVVSRQEGKWTHYRMSAVGSAEATSLLLKITTPDRDM